MVAPSATEWNGLFRSYAVCTLFLQLKYFVSVMIAADKEKAHLSEDRVLDAGLKNSDPVTWQRNKGVSANDLENIPLQVAIFWAAFLVQQYANASGLGKKETVALTVLFVVYTGMRFVHSICYYFALQPFRSISFMLSQFCQFGAGCILIASAFQIDTAKFGATN